MLPRTFHIDLAKTLRFQFIIKQTKRHAINHILPRTPIYSALRYFISIIVKFSSPRLGLNWVWIGSREDKLGFRFFCFNFYIGKVKCIALLIVHLVFVFYFY
jgi:hypothetical protein